MSRLLGLQCRECGHLYDLSPIHVCELCFGPLEVAYDYDTIRTQVSRESIAAGPQTIWRYRALLPVEDEPVVETYAGCTPLVKANNLGRALGLNQRYVKSDTVNPTCAFKDRPVAIATGRSLKENVGFTVSFLMYSWLRPSSRPRLSAFTSGVQPA